MLAATFAPLSAVAANLTGDGYIYLTEPTASWTPPSSASANSRFMWYPGKNALRFGDNSPYNYTWDNANIGDSSFSGGLDSKASGAYSFAFGQNALALGDYSFSFGYSTSASGDYSFAAGADASAADYAIAISGAYAHADEGGIAMGGSTYAGNYATALGYMAVAYEDYSIAIGSAGANAVNSVAIGSNAWVEVYAGVAIGEMAWSGGDSATAIGPLAQAGSIGAVALGAEALSDGTNSTAIGPYAQAHASRSVALGTNVSNRKMNGSVASPTTEEADDPVFMVSQAPIGTTAGQTATPATRNAFTVYRNGTAHLNGILRVKPGGDIPMFSTAKPSGVAYP